jgi:transposase-like protein
VRFYWIVYTYLDSKKEGAYTEPKPDEETDQMARERRTYTAEFKKQMVQLYENGKGRNEIVREYELTPSS